MGNQLTAKAPPPLHLVLVGLDAAGKTALLYRLALAEFVEPVPTRGSNAETVRLALGGARRRVRLQLWDVGGVEKLRPLWRSFTRRTDGLVFVVDASAPERLEETRCGDGGWIRPRSSSIDPVFVRMF
ncbi:ADP-ribosylation factor-like protein 4D [Gadus macrocephalus]|uniref:ADP-ribosylation factor-like protein 4D n=1 Tax=Gadus macrocephalus TaxID=80720 RepID=UPI0028CB2C31|nr:ADP-ribosylation factor-like protein 4D [Gadus macrocephalus]